MFIIVEGGRKAINIDLVNELEIVDHSGMYSLEMTLKGDPKKSEVLCFGYDLENLKKLLEAIITTSEHAFILKKGIEVYL